MSASLLACSTPVPGPFYWDWKCLRCGHAVAQHKSWWQKIKPSTCIKLIQEARDRSGT